MSWVAIRRVVIVLILAAGVGASCTPSQSKAPPVRDSILLPAVLVVPTGSPDDIAAALAARAVAGGRDRLPALLTAVRLAGIAVRDVDGHVAQQPARPSQGLAVQSGEMLALGQAGEGYNPVTLKDLADAVAGLTPPALQLTQAPVASMLIDGLQTQAASTSPTHRFWAHLIVELGKRSRRPYDLLANPDPAQVDLDGIQVFLIAVRLAGDLAAAGGWKPPHKAAKSGWPVTDAYAAGSLPCTLGEPDSTIMDASGVGISYGFRQVVKYALDHVGSPAAVATYEAFTGGFAGALAIAKFIATSLLLHKEIVLVNGPPLKRTRNASPGEQRQLEATLRFTTGRGQYANCFRILWNGLAGQDFNLPEDGPLENAEVTWHWGSGPVEFTSQGSGNPVVMKTDGEGKARTGVQGKAQKKQIPAAAKPVTVQANVYITIAVKTANFFQDLIDGLSVAAGEPFDIPIVLITNLMDRWGTRAAQLTFDVTDWPHDFVLDYTTNGVRFYGGVCDGPDGTWDIKVDGTIDQQGFLTKVSGDFTVSLQPPANVGGDARGTWSGQMAVKGQGTSGPVTVDIMASGSGPAAFRVSGDGGTLAFQPGPASGTVTGSGPDVSLSGLLFAQSNEVDFPVKVGSYCQ